ncbi:MAG: class A beta-lactamase [Bacteroidales bacterium]|jgi:beta-lactamase class A/lipopolysaccharide export system protein LptA|nr:class A beta-lactamase [Bacteroidales bacterium]
MRNALKPYIVLLPLLACLSAAFAQERAVIRKIEVTDSDSMIISSGMQRLMGNVRIVHDSIAMTCDSAHFYSAINTLDAFSRVHIVQSDSSTVDGDFAKYQGNVKFAEIWGNVTLEDKDAIMKTEHLYYDMQPNIAYYLTGAEIFNKGNDMVSRMGYYHRNVNEFYFKEDVVLHTPDYTILTDTLDYNVYSKVAVFVGPTLVLNESDTIFCERGWYNTNDTVALFRKNARIISGSTTVDADTLYYESRTGNGQAYGNIRITDTTNNVILHGQKGAYNQLSERAWLTGKALMIMAGEKDSLFLHGDTLRSVTDTAGFKIMKAYNRVKFFNPDMQGMCDSLAMSLRDTIVRMYRAPVLWAQGNQMTAEYIEIETEKQQPKRMNLLGKGFIASKEDTTGFNQIRGKKIVGLFRNDNELYRINVHEDGESVYFMKDGDFITGANKISSVDMVIHIENRQVQLVDHYTKAEGETIPIIEFDPAELTLTGFNWLEKHQPLTKDDIFHWGERQPTREEADENALSAASSETADSLRQKIELLIAGKRARIGVALMGADGGDTITVNHTVSFPAMSVSKYYIALAVMRLMDFGVLRPNQKIRVLREELRPGTHSPLRDDHPRGNIEPTVAELLSYMLSKSDNNACDILLKTIGGPKRAEQIVKSMGVAGFSIAATYREMEEDSSKIYLNTITPFSAVQALEVQRRANLLSESSRNMLWKMMTENAIGADKIKGKLPAGVVVGHKTGSSFRTPEGRKLADHDVGTVHISDKQHFFIAVLMADSMEDDAGNAAFIADIARLAWDFYRSREN